MESRFSSHAVLLDLVRYFGLPDAKPATLAVLMGWDTQEQRALLSRHVRAGSPEVNKSIDREKDLKASGDSPGCLLLSAVADRHYYEVCSILLGLCEKMSTTFDATGLKACVVALLKTFSMIAREFPSYYRDRFIVDRVMQAYPYTLPFAGVGADIQVSILRARVCAYRIGAGNDLAVLDIFLAAEFFRPQRVSKRALSLAAHRGRTALARIADGELAARLSPYIGMIDFSEGRFQQALGHFSQVKVGRGPLVTDVLYEQCSLYAARSAELLGNFTMSANIANTLVRQANTGSSFLPLTHYKLFMAIAMLARGKLDQGLELVDSVLNVCERRGDASLELSAFSVLAYYHLLCGNIAHSWHVFKNGAEKHAHAGLYHFVSSMPFLFELVYAWKTYGFASAGRLDFDRMVVRGIRSNNIHEKSIAIRISAQKMMFDLGIIDHGGCVTDVLSPAADTAALKNIEGMLLESLSLSRQYGYARERAKTCVILAAFYSAIGDRQQLSDYAAEAWSFAHLLQQHPWKSILSPLVRNMDVPEDHAHARQSKLYDGIAEGLRSVSYVEADLFLEGLVRTACVNFGVERGCILLSDDEDSTELILRAGVGMRAEEVRDRNFFSRWPFLEKAFRNEPSFASIHDAVIDQDISAICLPLDSVGGKSSVLYMEGAVDAEFASLLTPETLAFAAKLFTWEMGRFRNRPEQSAAFRNPSGLRYELVYASPAMARVIEKSDLLARSDIPILIYGETGTGKELIARRIHERSGRKGAFIAVNLANYPAELFESEFMGYEKGAFTGALQRKAGIFERADKGTVFIDELPDISLGFQVKLLRVLQEKCFFRLGGNTEISSDFRLITATNRNIVEEIESGDFRKDLFYRLCAVTLEIPPLRKRKEDIPVLARHFRELFMKKYGKVDLGHFNREDEAFLQDYAWPGNVRELKNVIEYAVITSSGRCRIDISCVSGSRGDASKPAGLFNIASVDGAPTLKEMEDLYIAHILTLTDHKIDGAGGAASVLGMKRANLYYRLGRKQ